VQGVGFRVWGLGFRVWCVNRGPPPPYREMIVERFERSLKVLHRSVVRQLVEGSLGRECGGDRGDWGRQRRGVKCKPLIHHCNVGGHHTLGRAGVHAGVAHGGDVLDGVEAGHVCAVTIEDHEHGRLSSRRPAVVAVAVIVRDEGGESEI